jgi:predicted deacylase
MLPGTLTPQPYRVFDGFWMRSRQGGLFRCRLQLRQAVRAGETVATIHDLLGRELEHVTAPHDGLIIGYRTVARIRPGDWTVWVGRLREPAGGYFCDSYSA